MHSWLQYSDDYKNIEQKETALKIEEIIYFFIPYISIDMSYFDKTQIDNQENEIFE